MSADITRLATLLDDAARHATAVAQISATETLTLAQAYEIQKLSIDKRLARGERRVGMKMGFTSRAKMEQMGVSDLIWGRLTHAMLAEDGGSISKKRFVHPRCEPEVAFLLKKPLSGIVTPLQALNAVEAVAPALEIIDSRYQNFKFSLTDVVADNSSSSALTIGPWNSPHQALDNLGMMVTVNGRAQSFGSTAAILGDPLRSLVSAARLVAESGEVLEAGHIVMAGGATAAFELQVGMFVQLEVERLGRTSFSVLE
ncbi:2-keto-4-pentenoate hydratase [Steroidobacter sp.]|uniref:2-keto-4-pentenoate hydratase n=1 Tax=Steroidobacter sp. TaxID=1978227 RepID=UPI001A4562E5|nr:fumarylacetoacetate hydrolase family protein [Steroidobacter sp.]MBL8268380.1 fumarylacetoacetate hydrolase family protein [Steroidobacter sp.]